jgi:Fe-S-cluster containining protein
MSIPTTETDRCSGECCRKFVLSVSYERLNRLAVQEDEEAVQVLDMLIPLGVSPTIHGEMREHFTCRHVQANGDCGIYETRPALCRRYPYGAECEHKDRCGWTAARAGMTDRHGCDRRQSIGLERMAVAPGRRWPGAIRWESVDLPELWKLDPVKK